MAAGWAGGDWRPGPPLLPRAVSLTPSCAQALVRLLGAARALGALLAVVFLACSSASLCFSLGFFRGFLRGALPAVRWALGCCFCLCVRGRVGACCAFARPCAVGGGARGALLWFSGCCVCARSFLVCAVLLAALFSARRPFVGLPLPACLPCFFGFFFPGAAAFACGWGSCLAV